MSEKTIVLVAAAVVIAAFLFPAAGDAEEKADVIFIGKHIYTLDDDRPTVDAVVVKGDRIVFAGGENPAREFLGESTRWIDLGDNMMIPGLVDAHAHVKGLGRYLANVRLTDTKSKSEILERVSIAQKDAPPGRWIRGRGWDQNDWNVKEFPTWRDLAGTEANPIYLRRVDGHASWVNKTALEMCGVGRNTPDPPGGKIMRDEAGNPTGVFIDEASDLISAFIPEPGQDELDQWITAAVQECNRYGLTGVHDAGTTRAELASFDRLHNKGMLTIRLYCMLDSDDEELLSEFFASGTKVSAGGRVVVRTVKLYADGALGSRGAALLEPYSDDPGNVGLLVDSPEKIERVSRRALDGGFQVCTHAIGDRGIRVALDVYEKVLAGRKGLDHRFRIEHSQIVSPADVPRYRELGVLPSMQPTHATSDMEWAEARVGTERIERAYAWRTFMDAGNRVPFGSDFPVESVNPLWGIYAAVTRQDHEGRPEHGWHADQCLTVLEAVKGFTTEAAYAGFAEDESGTIEAGKLADFTVLDRDIFKKAPVDILRAKVKYTIVGGKIVYQAD